jgi:hypothetical protein
MGFPLPGNAAMGEKSGAGRAETGRSTVIASEAKQSSFLAVAKEAGLLRRFAPRNDGG